MSGILFKIIQLGKGSIGGVIINVTKTDEGWGCGSVVESLYKIPGQIPNWGQWRHRIDQMKELLVR